MNKKGQLGVVTFVFMVIFFLIIWGVWLGSWLSQIGVDAIANNNLTGLEAFIFANLNAWVFIGLILGIVGFFYFGGAR